MGPFSVDPKETALGQYGYWVNSNTACMKQSKISNWFVTNTVGHTVSKKLRMLLLKTRRHQQLMILMSQWTWMGHDDNSHDQCQTGKLVNKPVVGGSETDLPINVKS